jgi:hypothetical protein
VSVQIQVPHRRGPLASRTTLTTLSSAFFLGAASRQPHKKNKEEEKLVSVVRIAPLSRLRSAALAARQSGFEWSAPVSPCRTSTRHGGDAGALQWGSARPFLRSRT